MKSRGAVIEVSSKKEVVVDETFTEKHQTNAEISPIHVENR